MTWLHNDPTLFVDEMIEGLVLAYGRWVQPVRGGVIRRQAPKLPKVAVVIGGGSGHYPAFGGLVGPGMADGAALGNVFASPSTAQVVNVATNSQNGAGVLLSYGNYAGDVLNFNLAQQQLEQLGIPCRTALVTDDVASASPEHWQARRGIAGDLIVFKMAGAAADEGRSLDEVTRIAEAANSRTRSLGVAFSGCTLPGASQPLFEVPAGLMAIGMGIHGEPGLREVEVLSADELANLLVAALIEERPAEDTPGERSSRATVLINGLGAVKTEELLVLYRQVARQLESSGVEIVEPEVGELVTSFDMAGLSLTLTWLDDELEALWRAPASSAGFRRTAPDPGRFEHRADPKEALASSPSSIAVARSSAAADVAEALSAIRDTIDANVEELGQLDAVAGDGDHGLGMQRGAQAAALAAQTAWQQGGGARTTLMEAAHAWADRAGGASGALWGVILRSMANCMNDSDCPTPDMLLAGIRSAVDGVQAAGGARVGDKTVLDAMIPFRDALADGLASNLALTIAWDAAATAASAGARATASMHPRIGRAKLHADQSLNSPDPGASSFALITHAVLDVLAESKDQ